MGVRCCSIVNLVPSFFLGRDQFPLEKHLGDPLEEGSGGRLWRHKTAAAKTKTQKVKVERPEPQRARRPRSGPVASQPGWRDRMKFLDTGQGFPQGFASLFLALFHPHHTLTHTHTPLSGRKPHLNRVDIQLIKFSFFLFTP